MYYGHEKYVPKSSKILESFPHISEMDFSSLPILLSQGGTPEEQQAKSTALDEMLKNDPNGLAIALSQIIIGAEDPSIISNASLILYRPMEYITARLFELAEGIVEQLFTKSLEYIVAFQDSHPPCVVIEICLAQYLNQEMNDQVTEMITLICQLFSQNSTAKVAHAITEIFSSIADDYLLEPEQYEPILSIIFPILYENSLAIAHKNALSTLSHLIESIDLIIESDENRSTVYEVLQSNVSKPQLRSAVYESYAQICERHYELFCEVAGDVLTTIIAQFKAGGLSTDDQISICYLLSSIAKSELYYMQNDEEHANIIQSTLQELITPIVQMAVSYSETESDQANSVPEAAYDLTGIITSMYPEAMIEVLHPFILENYAHQDEGFRTASYAFAYSILFHLSDSDFTEFVDALFQMIASVFDDPSPHVIATAMFLIPVIIKKFASAGAYDQIFPTLSEMMTAFMNHINDSPEVTPIICDIISKMSKQTEFPFFIDIFRTILPVYKEQNPPFVTSCTQLLEKLIKHCKEDAQINEIIPDYLGLFDEMVEHCKQDHSFLYNQGELFHLLHSLIKRSESPFIEHIPAILSALTLQFEEAGECDSVNVIVLAYFVKILIIKDRVAPSDFADRLDLFFAMCHFFITRFGNPNDISDGCSAFRMFMEAKAMLEQFVPVLIDSMIEGVNQARESFETVKSYIELFNFILKQKFESEGKTIEFIHKIHEIIPTLPVFSEDTLNLADSIVSMYSILFKEYPTEVAQWFNTIIEFVFYYSKLFYNAFDKIEDENLSTQICYNILGLLKNIVDSITPLPDIPEEYNEMFVAMLARIRDTDETIRGEAKAIALKFDIALPEDEEEE